MAWVVVIATTFSPSSEMCITFCPSADCLAGRAASVSRLATSCTSVGGAVGLALSSSRNFVGGRTGGAAIFAGLRLVCGRAITSSRHRGLGHLGAKAMLVFGRRCPFFVGRGGLSKTLPIRCSCRIFSKTARQMVCDAS